MNLQSDGAPAVPLLEIKKRFICQRCGNCCRGEGFVFLDDDDLRRLAHYFGIGIVEFMQTYTRITEDDDCVLLDQGDEEKSCIFLHEGRCVAQPAKPLQCQGFPLRWRTPDTAEYCAGWRAALGLPPPERQAPKRGMTENDPDDKPS